MREILFRGKHVHAFSCNTPLDGTWVYGYLVDKNYINDKRDLGGGEYLGEMLVDPETIGQFTGLLDKNGTKIFEGDIVKYDSWVFEETNKETCQGTGTGTVYFKLGSFRVSAPKCEDDCALIDCEVIGNIHDNPELLTQ